MHSGVLACEVHEFHCYLKRLGQCLLHKDLERYILLQISLIVYKEKKRCVGRHINVERNSRRLMKEKMTRKKQERKKHTAFCRLHLLKLQACSRSKRANIRYLASNAECKQRVELPRESRGSKLTVHFGAVC